MHLAPEYTRMDATGQTIGSASGQSRIADGGFDSHPAGYLASMLAVPLGLLAALLNAAASVLQRRAGSEESDERAFSVHMLLELARRPVWFLGILAMFVGFVVQAIALTLGSVSTVQPLLVAELPFTFMLASVVFRARPSRSEWLATASLTAGLVLFLLCLGPEGGGPLAVPRWQWLVGLAATGAVEGVAVLLGLASSGHRRAALLGIATGIGFGLTAALTAAAGAAYHQQGLLGVLLAWQTYAILMIGPLSLYLLQNALGAGSLVASQPGLTLANPVVAVGWGVLVFGERTRGGGWTVGVVAGALLIAAGTVLLARSPLLTGDGQRGGGKRSDAAASL